MSEYTENQLRYRRSLGVSRAWEKERELVRQGRGTRQWTAQEQKQLLSTGRVKGYQGHHMKSVSKYPHYADDPKNIQFLNSRKGNNEHLKAHKGDYRTPSEGRYNVNTGKIRPMQEGKPRAMNAYELKEKAITSRGYTKYATKPGNAQAPSPARAYSSSAKAKDAPKASPGKQYANNQKDAKGKQYSRAFVKQGSKQGQRNASSGAGQSSSGKASPNRYGRSASGAQQGATSSRKSSAQPSKSSSQKR